MSNCMFLNMNYSLVHFKCTQMSHNLKFNIADIESQKILALINLCCLGLYYYILKPYFETYQFTQYFCPPSHTNDNMDTNTGSCLVVHCSGDNVF